MNMNTDFEGWKVMSSLLLLKNVIIQEVIRSMNVLLYCFEMHHRIIHYLFLLLMFISKYVWYLSQYVSPTTSAMLPAGLGPLKASQSLDRCYTEIHIALSWTTCLCKHCHKVGLGVNLRLKTWEFTMGMTCIRLECVGDRVRYFHLVAMLVLSTCWVRGGMNVDPFPLTS